MLFRSPVAKDIANFKQFKSTKEAGEPGSDTTYVLAMVGSGLAASSVHEFTIVINYEFIPKYNAINIIDASPSPQDATETDLVENWVQELDLGTIIPTKTLARSPAAVEPKHEDEPSGFGMFASVVSEILPFALALL